MATRVGEVVHFKEKSISAPSTPLRTFHSHGRQTTADNSPSSDNPPAPESPSPNYLRPTISSRYNTCCRFPKSQQQHTEDPVAAATAGKRLNSVKSMEHLASPSSLPHKTPKERTPRTDLSPKPALSPKIVPEKSSKAPTSKKTLIKARSLPKSVLKRREVSGSTSTTSASKLEQEEKVLPIDNGVQGHATPHDQSRSPKSKSESKHQTTSEESDNGKPRAQRVKATKKVSGNEGAPRKLRFLQGREVKGESKEAVGERLKSKQSGKVVDVEGEGKAEQENVALRRQEAKEKEETPAYNDVIEQAAAKLAMRSKVKALVGAFESVISLQEPESQPSQQQEEEAVKVGRVRQPDQPKPEEEDKVGEEIAERGQPDRVKPEKEVKVGEDGAEKGQPGKQQPKEVVKEEEECRQDESNVVIRVKSLQKETKGEEQSGDDESKDGQPGQDSQQKETVKERKGEDESMAEKDDGYVTKELTEPTEEDEGVPLEPLDC